ncbi:hypothetical protein BH23VER1_BH23VER1_10300 [soil metagenome]
MNSFAPLILLAAEGPAPQPGANPLNTFIPIILMFVIFYFVLIRPQRKRQKELAEQVAAIKTGDHVLTSGGIHGIVANVKERTIILRVADNVKIEFEKSGVQAVIKKKDAPGTVEAEVIEDEPKG